METIFFKDWLLLRRREAGLTQEELAGKLKVSDQTVRNWEKGRSSPSLSLTQLDIFCNVLKCSSDEIPRE